MKYFISGHRDLTQEEFNEHYISKLERILELDKYAIFIIGDWEGCDTLVFEYLKNRLGMYQSIGIYYVGKIRFINFNQSMYPHIVGYRWDSYDSCDSMMTYYSDFDVAWVRPGKEDSHTAMNIKRRYYGKV